MKLTHHGLLFSLLFGASAFAVPPEKPLTQKGALVFSGESTNCWNVTGALSDAAHQYYDVPAWNCNGSAIMFRGQGEKMYLRRRIGGVPSTIAIRTGKIGYMHWDTHQPEAFYYVALGSNKTTLVRQLIAKDDGETIYEAEGQVELAVPHPDGEHLLLMSTKGQTTPALIVSISARTAIAVPMPAPVHRVRFTKAPDLSIFVNTEKPKKSRIRRIASATY